ncbi:DUF1853 family protein [Zunongwangia sp. F363]|uniref:DUF1853 family protein n=1 Tax=Autumnicola tepida TaxID=3075595 RepID=A0ABU3CCG8_9FLAO|nr:DUF1853 family protein [Zunongwangia sp. F363]MDT0643978.1 DUF1853 family protein [Zunongwangia sp. F363]
MNIQKQFKGFLSTPPLWDNGNFLGLKQFNLPVAEIPQEILQNLHSSRSILGKRVENFFEFLINNTSRYKVLLSNIQIHQEKIKLGEIDFLLKDLQEEKPYHIELVYKFYVYDPSFEDELHRWIGPNRRDSLLQKVQKLRERQFPLLFRPETGNLLKSAKLKAGNIHQQVCFKANLFLPKQFNYKKIAHLNKACIAGYWINFDAFKGEEYEKHKFYSPKKQDWPVNPSYGRTWVTYEQIQLQIASFISREKAPLVWMKKGDETYERFFVVWW